MNNNYYFVFDLETLGLKIDLHQIAEFACVILDNDFKELAYYQSYFRPRPPVIFEESALKVNGLTIEKLYQEGVSGLEICQNINDLLRLTSKDNWDIKTICMNKMFDCVRLEKEFAYWGLTPHSHYADKFDIRDQVKNYNLLPDYINLKNICELFNISTEGAHGALADARMTAECYRRLEIIKNTILPDWNEDAGKQLLNFLRK